MKISLTANYTMGGCIFLNWLSKQFSASNNDHQCLLATYSKFLMRMFACHPGEGNGTPLQYSCLENPMVGGAWWAAVHGVTKSGTRLSDFTFTFHFHALEKEMATHFSILAWKIPWLEEPGGLQPWGHRVRDN